MTRFFCGEVYWLTICAMSGRSFWSEFDVNRSTLALLTKICAINNYWRFRSLSDNMSQPATQVLRSFSPSQPTIRPYCLSKLCRLIMQCVRPCSFFRPWHLYQPSLSDTVLRRATPSFVFWSRSFIFFAYLKAVAERLKKIQCSARTNNFKNTIKRTQYKNIQQIVQCSQIVPSEQHLASDNHYSCLLYTSPSPRD